MQSGRDAQGSARVATTKGRAALPSIDGLISWLKGVVAVSPPQLALLGAQLLGIALALLVAVVVRRLTVVRTDALVERIDPRFRDRRMVQALRPLVVPALWWAAVVLLSALIGGLGYGNGTLRIAGSLLLAWIVIHASSALVRDPFLSRAIATVIWLIVALDILGLLGAAEATLDDFAVTLGTMRLSLLGVLKAAIALTLLLWAAFAVSRVIQQRVAQIDSLTPSVQVLIANLLKITLVGLAVVVALNTIGLDLTGLAVFSGAVGVGVGFGLQKIVSNLVSGIILLLDKSIKPGDVIEIEQTFGWITSLGARYVSVRSRDGKEYLIPNEDLITHRVVNWSYSSPLVRLDVVFGVAYGSDLREVRALATAAALAPKRILREPGPACHVTAFGDSAVELVLRVWIRDPTNGVTNIKGEVYLALYEALNAKGIELPVPRRDVRIREDARRRDAAADS
jgi:small-conductance mechanosensitive channel